MPNEFGGRENLEAIAFFRRLNDRVHAEFPDVLTIAEESTAWPLVIAADQRRRPRASTSSGTWAGCTTRSTTSPIDPIYRKHHHNLLTFRGMYAFTENFVLPLSHDEVVHGKGSLLNKMPGDDWQKFANLRLLFGYMYAQPGKKLLFMGDEFGQWREWNHDTSLDWHLLDEPLHQGLRRWVRDLNTAYRGEPALHQLDFRPDGFAWVDVHDAEQSVIGLLPQGPSADDIILIACNFTPVPRHNYRVGVPRGGHWKEILNCDAPALRRQRPGEHRRGPHHAGRLARTRPVGEPRAPAAGDGRAQVGRPASLTITRRARDPTSDRCAAMALAAGSRAVSRDRASANCSRTGQTPGDSPSAPPVAMDSAGPTSAPGPESRG